MRVFVLFYKIRSSIHYVLREMYSVLWKFWDVRVAKVLAINSKGEEVGPEV